MEQRITQDILMNVISFCLLILSIFFFNTLFAEAESTGQYYYKPKTSQISGLIEWHKFSDAQPPYFRDGKDGAGNPAPEVNVLVLIPDRPINVLATDDFGPEDEHSYHNVRVLEIDVMQSKNMERYLGHHVKIFGYLHERQNGFEYTDVLIDPKSVDPAPHQFPTTK